MVSKLRGLLTLENKERTLGQICADLCKEEKSRDSIGLLGEKVLHAGLKVYFEPDTQYHEVKINGFVADICNANGIIEIQTRNLGKLKRKLEIFLEQMPVTVVYPIAHMKHLCWVDEETGVVTSKRKSPKVGSVWDLFRELYSLREMLEHPNFSVCAALIDLEEYRLLNGWSKDKKKGSTRYERIPTQLYELIYLYEAEDYSAIMPNALPKQFTSKEFHKLVRISLSSAQRALLILNELGVVERVGKQKNAYLYQLANKNK